MGRAMASDSQPRVPMVSPGADPALAAIEARIAAERGKIGPLYRVLLNSAPIADGWERMLTAVRKKTSLAPNLREMAIMRVAVLTGVELEFNAHVPFALAAGVTQEKIDALRADALAGCFDPLEHAVLEFADAMTRNVRVDPAVFDRLRPHLDATALVELAATVAAYNMVTRFLEAMEIR